MPLAILKKQYLLIFYFMFCSYLTPHNVYASSPSCLSYLNTTLNTTRLNPFPEFDIRVRQPRRQMTLGRHWFLKSLIGDYELVISEKPMGLQFAVIPRRNENPITLKKILEILLAYHFGATNVGYPIKSDLEISEHLEVKISFDRWSDKDINAKLAMIEKNLQEMPSRQTTSAIAIRASTQAKEDLIAFGMRYFPEVSPAEFVFRASFYIPFFVDNQSNIGNLAFNEDVFSTRDFVPDPKLERTLSVLFQTPVDLMHVRTSLRAQFISEFKIEMTTMLQLRESQAQWRRLLRNLRPKYKDRKDAYAIFGAEMLNELNKYNQLAMHGIQALAYERSVFAGLLSISSIHADDLVVFNPKAQMFTVRRPSSSRNH